MKQSFLLYKRLTSYIQKHDLIPEGSSLILGLSGGPDSLFLLYFLVHLRYTKNIHITAAHLDHQWRADSEKDVIFCRSICQSLNINFITECARNVASLPNYNGSKEEQGRIIRRLFFEKIAQENNASIITLGHHANDQHETFFIRLARGSSLAGLVGMRPHAGLYVRPLLCIYKEEITAYLDANNISYLQDPTNTSDVFLRNKIRNDVLPVLQKADPRFTSTFARTLEHLQKTEAFLDRFCKQQYEQVTKKTTYGDELNVTFFKNFDQLIQQRILIFWLCSYKVPFKPHEGFFIELITFLTHKRGGLHQLNPTWAIRKKKNFAYIILISKE